MSEQESQQNITLEVQSIKHEINLGNAKGDSKDKEDSQEREVNNDE